MTDLLPLALGLMLLFMGRRLFWFFVGGVGFAVGLQAAPLLLGPQPFWMVWAVGLIAGLAGALLALFFQHLAIAVGGFAAGVSLAIRLLPAADTHTAMLAALACGIAGAVALFLFFDWVLVVLSALLGACLIVDAIGRPLSIPAFFTVLLAAAGVAVQVRLMKKSRKTAT